MAAYPLRPRTGRPRVPERRGVRNRGRDTQRRHGGNRDSGDAAEEDDDGRAASLGWLDAARASDHMARRVAAMGRGRRPCRRPDGSDRAVDPPRTRPERRSPGRPRVFARRLHRRPHTVPPARAAHRHLRVGDRTADLLLFRLPGIWPALPLSVAFATAVAAGYWEAALAIGVWFGVVPVLWLTLSDGEPLSRVLRGSLPDVALLASVWLLGETIGSR